MKELMPLELKKMFDSGDEFVLLDVREAFEREASSIGGLHIPMAEVKARINEIPTGKAVVVYCASGFRSARIASMLEADNGYGEVYNLAGGIGRYELEVGIPS